jgi:hypothetical protein
MDFCYVWLRQLIRTTHPEFARLTTRHANELTGNFSMGRTLEHFAAGMSRAFCRMAQALKPGAPLAFTYHHNQLDAYFPVAVAILDSGLVCSASLPCPAEMGASIHINGTGSSIIDTVFVCRSTGRFPRRWLADNPVALGRVISEDLRLLRSGHVMPTQGDIRCIACGHLIRLVIWNLRHAWNPNRSVGERTATVRQWAEAFGSIESVLQEVGADYTEASPMQQWQLRDEGAPQRSQPDEVPF